MSYLCTIFTYFTIEQSLQSWLDDISMKRLCAFSALALHWNQCVVILMKLSSLSGQKLSIVTPKLASDNNFIKTMTFPVSVIHVVHAIIMHMVCTFVVSLQFDTGWFHPYPSGFINSYCTSMVLFKTVVTPLVPFSKQWNYHRVALGHPNYVQHTPGCSNNHYSGHQVSIAGS